MRSIFLLVISLGVLGYVIFIGKKEGVKTPGTYVKNEPSIAVLPFANVNDNPEQTYFSDGLAEGILNSLSQVKYLEVCARSSSFQFRGKDIDIKEVGKKLGVQIVLEGSLKVQGDRVQIITQLTNAESGR